jgi:hypothetical protein
MPPRLPFQQGSQVEHDRFGLGSVVSINEDRITIRYDEHGEKTFVTSIAVTQLRKSDREPPSEKKKARKTAAGSATKKASKKKETEAPQEG